MSETSSLFIGGSLSAAAVAAVSWFVKTLIERQLKQMDEAFARVQFQIAGLEEDVANRLDAIDQRLRENEKRLPEIRADLDILRDRVRRLEQSAGWALEETKPNRR